MARTPTNRLELGRGCEGEPVDLVHCARIEHERRDERVALQRGAPRRRRATD